MQTRQERGIQVNGGRFDFDDGGTYCGGWEDGKAHGHGVCTGPKGQGEYSGSWHYGFEVSGVYTWPSGSTFEGHWQNGKRHGLGVETRGRWVYRGEWTQGFKGRYGVRQSTTSGAKYEGTWANGLQDGYGSETYADNGTFQGQWLRGMRHGYGVRTSAPFGLASFYRGKTARASLTSLRSENAADPASERDRKMDDCRGGFVLKAKSDEPPARRRSLVEKSTNLKKTILQGFRIKKQRSTGDIDKRGTGSIRSTGSCTSWASQESAHSGVTGTGSVHTDSNVSFVSQDDVIDANVTETYMGEWKNDKRCGFGISERSDGLKYEGEWYNNKKYGYGLTTFRDQTREEGKYKNNVLITSNKKKHLFLIRSVKFRERIDSAVSAAVRGSQIALQKADIAISRTATARGKAEQADVAALHAREDSGFARMCAKQFAPDFHQPGMETLKKNAFDEVSHEMQPISKPADDVHQFRSKSHYIRKEGSEQDLNSSNYGLSGSDDHLSPGGLQMSLDYGNPKFHDVDHLPPGEEPMLPSANQKSGVHSNYNQIYHQQQQQQQQQQMNQSNRDGTHLRNGGHDQKLANRSNYSNPTAINDATTAFSLRGSIRRGKNLSIRGNTDDSRYTLQHAMNDHFDHYKANETSAHTRSSTPSSLKGGSSTTVASALAFVAAIKNVGRAAKTPSPLIGGNSNGTDWTPDSGVSDDMDTDESPTRPSRRSTLPNLYAEMMAANEAKSRRNEEQNLRLRTQIAPVDIPLPLPSNSPIRTASLYVNNSLVKKPGASGASTSCTPTKRKKSLPDIQALPKQMPTMSREEVSVLSSARREEVRRQQEEAERYRANPLLYIVSPHVKDWFSRQQLMMLVLIVNISLAIMFFKLLT